jgi:hypothetical protein
MAFGNRSNVSRASSVTIDAYGIDPLRDKVIEKIAQITRYDAYTVQQHERGRPDLISYRKYQTCHYWWVILAYNNIGNWRRIREGVVLKLPILADIVQAIANVESENTMSAKGRIIEI